MSFVYPNAHALLLSGGISLSSDDIRAILLKVKASTSCDTETSAAFISDFTTLGEISATNYARLALTGEAVTVDVANSRSLFAASYPIWPSLGGASNDTVGALLLYKHVSTDANSIPIAYIDDAGSDFSRATNGLDFMVVWNWAGILQSAS